MKILVFDDVLCRRQGEYTVPGLLIRFYEHADDAVAVVQREHPELVLMDYSMEEHRSGEEAVRALRAAFPRRTLSIVAISSDAASNDRMLDAGADDVVPKSHLRGYLSRLAK